MIDWKVENGEEVRSEEGWYFPSFHIQEYLLPIINVGHSYIDEYNDTVFTKDDCMRIKGNIEYMLDSGILDRKPVLHFDTMNEGVRELDTNQIKVCLVSLSAATDMALKESGVLKFYGD